MLNVVVLSVIMLNAIVLCVIMLSVMATQSLEISKQLFAQQKYFLQNDIW
jgi:hypothetical protein